MKTTTFTNTQIGVEMTDQKIAPATDEEIAVCQNPYHRCDEDCEYACKLIASLVARIDADREKIAALEAELHSEQEINSAMDVKIRALEDHIEELKDKMFPDTHCACSYDNAGLICMAHSPTVHKLNKIIENLTNNKHEA